MYIIIITLFLVFSIVSNVTTMKDDKTHSCFGRKCDKIQKKKKKNLSAVYFTLDNILYTPSVNNGNALGALFFSRFVVDGNMNNYHPDYHTKIIKTIEANDLFKDNSSAYTC